MNQLISGIWQNAPVWVWPLFFVLLFIGLMAMRPRQGSIVPYFFYPLFGLTAAKVVNGLVQYPLNWIAFAAFYLLGAVMAFRWQDRLIVAKTGWTMQQKGDRITFLVLMLIFFSNFANGVATAVAPQVLATPLYTVIFAGIIGICSGSFTGRAARVITLGNRPATSAVVASD